MTDSLGNQLMHSNVVKPSPALVLRQDRHAVPIFFYRHASTVQLCVFACSSKLGNMAPWLQ